MEIEGQPPPAKELKLTWGEEQEKIMGMLGEYLEKHDNNRKAVQDKIKKICDDLRTQVDELEKEIFKELEERYSIEDSRLQEALGGLRINNTVSALQKAKAELLVMRSYDVIENRSWLNHYKIDHKTLYVLKMDEHFFPEMVEVRKPSNVRVTDVNNGKVSVQFDCLNPDEERVLSEYSLSVLVKYKLMLFKKDVEQESVEYPLHNKENDFFAFTSEIFESRSTYGIRVKIIIDGKESEWSDIAEFTSPEFKERCVWKECPGDVRRVRKYIVDEDNPRIAIKVGDDGYNSTIVGCIAFPKNTVTSWNVKVLKSKYNDGNDIHIGVAPYDISQDDDNYDKCGWYLDCYYSELYSGPPNNYDGKEYGPRRISGQYVHTGDIVGVVIDAARGDLSFILDGVNLGVAYGGIPLDKPLVPCVLLKHFVDSVELDTSETKEKVDNCIHVPSNITIKNIAWDTITLKWDQISDDTSFYQIEVDESKSIYVSTTSTFTKRGLLPETEHSFRVRTVKGSSVSEWSGVVKGRTLKAPDFSECAWKECPDDVDEENKYSVDEKDSKTATKINSVLGYCTIMGNTHIPLNAVTPWSVKILKSENNDGNGLIIGIAPFDVNQSNYENNDIIEECGWYFDCCSSTLYSGPPHDYDDKEYGPRKGDGQYVHTGDSVGVVVDTVKGELSFVLNGVNLGVAYEGIPLDKPLVPCVFLYCKDDSVEIIV